ncbi:hypothetical protein [Nostoc sp.]|uniref:hypothetical protein n=1 Tax=Nostoc sp. TaxID=1180 RepID=UPI002FF69CD1
MPRKQGRDGQCLLAFITDVEELLLRLTNFYGNLRLRFPIYLKIRGFCSLFISSGKSNVKINPLASFFSGERVKIKGSPLQGYPLVTSFLTFVVAMPTAVNYAATTFPLQDVTRSLLRPSMMTNAGTQQTLVRINAESP